MSLLVNLPMGHPIDSPAKAGYAIYALSRFVRGVTKRSCWKGMRLDRFAIIFT